MNRRTKIGIAGGAVVLALGAGSFFGVAAATGGDDDNDKPIEGPALVQARNAALAETGEGRVTDTEVGDEDSFYEVEVTLDNRQEVDVQLDEQFNVVGSEVETNELSDSDGGEQTP